MPSNSSFTPGNSTTITASGTTGNVALPSGSTWDLLISNNGSVAAFINVGNSSSVTAAADGTNMAILPGAIMQITISNAATYIAAITASSTAVLYITRGVGA